MPGGRRQRLPVQADRHRQAVLDAARVAASMKEHSAGRTDGELEDIEVELFVRALQARHGYDFSQYAPASLKRRVQQLVHAHGTGTISALTGRLLHEADFLTTVLE